MLRDCSDLLGDPYQRRGIVRDLTNETWQWVWLNLDAVLTPGDARLSTRLNAQAYWRGRAWKTAQLRYYERWVQEIDDAWIERRSILGGSSERWDEDRMPTGLAA